MRIAFVDDLCHKKTGSTEFLVDVLNKTNTVKRFWGNGFKKFDEKELEQINNWKPDLILFFQRIPNFLILNKFSCKNLVFVPMHDQEIHYSFIERSLLDFSLFMIKLFFRLRVLCFCNADSVRYNNFDLLLVKYYPKPVKSRVVLKETVYFWERTNGIGLSLARKLVKKSKLVVKYKDVWLTKAENKLFAKDCGIYIAPRYSEGIGHSFLEQMARGICVIAFDAPIHNEYIAHGVNGILYNSDLPVCFENWEKLGIQAKQSIVKGRKRWLKDVKKIVKWLEEN